MEITCHDVEVSTEFCCLEHNQSLFEIFAYSHLIMKNFYTCVKCVCHMAYLMSTKML